MLGVSRSGWYASRARIRPTAKESEDADGNAHLKLTYLLSESGPPLAQIREAVDVQVSRLAGLDPTRYLTDVLGRVATHPSSRIDELMPDRWEKQTADAPAQAAPQPQLVRRLTVPEGPL